MEGVAKVGRWARWDAERRSWCKKQVEDKEKQPATLLAVSLLIAIIICSPINTLAASVQSSTTFPTRVSPMMTALLRSETMLEKMT